MQLSLKINATFSLFYCNKNLPESSHISVEHDPVSGSRSNRILQFRTGSGLDGISKKSLPDRIWISKPEMIIIRFAGWTFGRIVTSQPDTNIQKPLSNGNRIRTRLYEKFYLYFEDSDFWKKLYITKSFIYDLQKHLFSLLCHDSDSVYGVSSVLQFNPIPPLYLLLDTPNLSARVCSWCGKMGLFQEPLHEGSCLLYAWIRAN